MSQKNPQIAQEEQVVSTVNGVEEFFKKYEKVIVSAFICILVVVCAGLAINKWYLTPAKLEAQSQMFPAEQKFIEGDFETALNGDGNILGFEQIASQYGSKAGKSVWLYKGICELQLGNNEEALESLKKYKTSDKIMMGRAICCMGDANANLGQSQKALELYKKAAAIEDNAFAAAYLLKAGIMAESLGQKEAAISIYEQIKEKYPQTLEGYEADKYISRINEAK